MVDDSNAQLRLARRPQGAAVADDFELTHDAMPMPRDGEVLVRCHYLSVDPSARTHWNEGSSYRSMVQLGDVIDAPAAGEVIASRHPDFVLGDLVVVEDGGAVAGAGLEACPVLPEHYLNGEGRGRGHDQP